ARAGLYSQLYLAQTQVGRRAKEGAIDDHEVIESLTKVLGDRAHAETHPEAAAPSEDGIETIGVGADGHEPAVEDDGPAVSDNGAEGEQVEPPTVKPAHHGLALEGDGGKLSHRNGHGRVTAKL